MQNLTIYRSSAGSGKTYTLVKEYLQIALQYPMHFRKILAITFTNKATAEMKGRIIKALGELANGSASDLAKDLETSLNLTDCTLPERAGEVLSNILHHYSNFSISTIDSFFNDIVKSLANELKLSLRFEIELDQNYIISKACDQLLNLVGTDHLLKRNLELFINYKMEYDKGWRIKDELYKIANRLFDDTSAPAVKYDEGVYSNIIAQLRKIRFSYEKTMADYGNKFSKALEEHGYTTEDFAYKKSGVAGYFLKIISTQQPKDYKPGKRALEISMDDEKWISKENRNDQKLLNLVQAVCHPLLLELLAFHDENFIVYNSAVEALQLIYVSGILSKINEEIIHYRDDNNIITLSDANRLIRSSVQSSDTPLVFEKTGNFFSHYLLDEFQDTSTIQWENIRPLISEVLANNKSALLVGDVKQSIYRWRGGNMELLHDGVEKDFSAFKELIDIRQLSINYRSAKQIVEFNNAFFVEVPAILETYNLNPLPLVKEAYSATQLHQQLPEKFNEDGFVQINFLEKNNDKEHRDEEHWKDRSLSMMLEQITTLLTLQYSYSDIAILVRNNKEGNMIANFLYKNGIHQILSNDSLLLSKAPQVLFVINCIRLLLEPENVLLIKEIEWFLNNPISSNEDSLHHFFDTKSSNISKSQPLAAFLKIAKKLNTLPVDEVATFIISHFNLNKIPDAYLQRLQDVTIEYLEKNPSDINSFIKWWEEINTRKNYSVIMPAAGNAIQIITIHKSKGLQFPIVIMPFTDWDLKPKSGELLWAPSAAVPPFDKLDEWPVQSGKNLEETVFSNSYLKSIEENYIDNLNLLYVAFTRACQQLYLTVLKKNESKEKTVSDLINDTLRLLPDVNTEAESITFGTLIQKSTAESGLKKPGIFSPETSYLSSYPIHNWHDKLSLKTETVFTSREIETGLMVHQVLSLIHREKDLAQAIYKVKSLYHLKNSEIESLESEIHKLFELCRPQKWFDGIYAVINETEFCAADGTLHRPDRVMIKDKKAIIIDYKTGEENDAHHRQAMKYKQLLTACGYGEVECWIVYSTTKKLVPVK